MAEQGCYGIGHYIGYKHRCRFRDGTKEGIDSNATFKFGLEGIIMSKKLERWDCIFVGRIGSDGRIYLTQPQKYGYMYANHGHKVKESMNTPCGQIKDSSNVSKMLRAIAIATAYNKDDLKAPSGLVLRGFLGGKPFATPETWRVNSPYIGTRVKGTVGWIAYVSHKEEFYWINGRYKSDKLTEAQSDLIRGCIADIHNNWK